MSVKRDALIYFAAEAVAKGAPFLLIPFLTYSLGVEQFGYLSYLQAITALLMVLFQISADGALGRYVTQYGVKGLARLKDAAHLYGSVSALILFYPAYLLLGSTGVILILVALLQAWFLLQQSEFQFRKLPKLFALFQVGNGCFSVLVVLVLFNIRAPDVELYFLGVGGVFFLVLLGGRCFQKKEAKPHASRRWDKKRLRGIKLYLAYILSFGAPLLLHHFAFWAKGQFDRVFLLEQYGRSAVGVFASGYQVAQIALVILMVLNRALVPHMFDRLKAGGLGWRALSMFCGGAMFAMLVVVVCVCLLPVEAFIWLLGPGFDEAKPIATLFLVAHVFMVPYLIFVNVLFYYARTKTVAAVNVCSALLYVMVMVLVVDDGVAAVPVAAIISNILLVILVIGFVKYYALLEGDNG